MLFWCQLLAEQADQEAVSSADLAAMAMWDPAALARVRERLIAEPEKPADQGAAAVARAERILHLIDSGSGPSSSRLSRRTSSREQR